jgi:uncharacterized RDD family membrane protein YckC
MGIRVRRLDGQPVTAGTAALREILVKGAIGLVGGLLLYIPILVNFLWPLWDDKGQALHDKPVNTVVTRA